MEPARPGVTSAYLEPRRDRYDQAFLGVSRHGDWQTWLLFFLGAVATQSRATLARAEQLRVLRDDYRLRVSSPWSSSQVPVLIDGLFASPALTIAQAQHLLGVIRRAASQNIDKLIRAGILEEVQTPRRTRLSWPEASPTGAQRTIQPPGPPRRQPRRTRHPVRHRLRRGSPPQPTGPRSHDTGHAASPRLRRPAGRLLRREAGLCRGRLLHRRAYRGAGAGAGRWLGRGPRSWVWPGRSWDVVPGELPTVDSDVLVRGLRFGRRGLGVSGARGRSGGGVGVGSVAHPAEDDTARALGR